MTKKRDRAFAAFGATLFLLTFIAGSVSVIYALTQQNKQSSNTAKENPVDNGQRLQGTKLANFTPVDSIPELKTVDTTPGTGEEVKAGATVTTDYTGAVASTGVIFQSSKDTGQPVSFPLSGVIAGWSQGVPGMKVGGTRRLFIPASLAYGANPPAGSGIPANADLVFDITVHKVQ